MWGAQPAPLLKSSTTKQTDGMHLIEGGCLTQLLLLSSHGGVGVCGWRAHRFCSVAVAVLIGWVLLTQAAAEGLCGSFVMGG
jgi:hypothetical protein